MTTENTCDNCGKPLREKDQVKVDTVDGVQFVCAECATEFEDKENE